MSPASGPRLALRVTEQPAKLHRFRYLKEIKDGRMGSILHCRSSPKTPVKVEVTAAAESHGVESCPIMKLVGCTVFDDLAPHPFFLFGDDCNSGIFEKEISLSAAGNYRQEVSLDRIGIVCTPKKRRNGKAGKAEEDSDSAQQEGNYQTRVSVWNLFNKPAKKNPTQGKEVNKLRLAFQVFVQQPDSKQWTAAVDCNPVFTELILDAKIFSELTVDYVIPKTVLRIDQDIWLYMKDPLPGESEKRFKVTLKNKKSGLIFDLPAKSVKKHLVVFDFTTVKSPLPNGSTAVKVVDMEAGDESETVELELKFTESEPASKRSRQERSMVTTGTDDLLFDLLAQMTQVPPEAFNPGGTAPDESNEFYSSEGQYPLVMMKTD